jgi:hypothetical protein
MIIFFYFSLYYSKSTCIWIKYGFYISNGNDWAIVGGGFVVDSIAERNREEKEEKKPNGMRDFCYYKSKEREKRTHLHNVLVMCLWQVRSSETNKDFVSRNFAYYDCSRHTTCSSCVKAQWACNWCVHENRCTHNASTCQRTVVSGENVSTLNDIWRDDSEFIKN